MTSELALWWMRDGQTIQQGKWIGDCGRWEV